MYQVKEALDAIMPSSFATFGMVEIWIYIDMEYALF